MTVPRRASTKPAAAASPAGAPGGADPSPAGAPCGAVAGGLLLPTPHGPARAHLHLPAAAPRFALVLGHGAGGGVAAPDLVAVTAALVEDGAAVALVEQPYRVAGRRSAAPARQLDVAWEAVVAQLRAGPLAGLALVTGGRSSGARVACRTALAVQAAGVLCLAFPLQPPARRDGSVPPDRLPELKQAGVPVLVVQGERDRFGMPPRARGRTISVVRGDHALRGDRAAIVAAVRGWLRRLRL
ncbi:alpha/beta hydrolase [Conexibacter sp. JD483]|uniref:alpha/beta hydrolase family protein n=1 Tax=unclassified Conexibacter TaxID=2627773 RepID=UPI0027214EFF|nr:MULTISPECIES: alpha/beta family hydrolase [unclassified Conexibacter]MDO8187341.1 alpha/beta hydrolase [Conexibacter sp. CPCC 205706]MDO8200526.1 alpha/beta hydrolase [Conexibacter sp. CPCC 205762]MDR9370005.1 alpha/beta hydrolase [Conexibacter sp. JD483]